MINLKNMIGVQIHFLIYPNPSDLEYTTKILFCSFINAI